MHIYINIYFFKSGAIPTCGHSLMQKHLHFQSKTLLGWRPASKEESQSSGSALDAKVKTS